MHVTDSFENPPGKWTTLYDNSSRSVSVNDLRFSERISFQEAKRVS
jgi:hypothetical protein